MHALMMIFMAIMPMGASFFNFFIPLQIGARDVAFPRLNALSYWVFLSGSLILFSSFFLGGAPDAGWFAYAPLTDSEYSVGSGLDFYCVGLIILGLSSLMASLNFAVTILNMRAPGFFLSFHFQLLQLRWRCCTSTETLLLTFSHPRPEVIRFSGSIYSGYLATLKCTS